MLLRRQFIFLNKKIPKGCKCISTEVVTTIGDTAKNDEALKFAQEKIREYEQSQLELEKLQHTNAYYDYERNADSFGNTLNLRLGVTPTKINPDGKILPSSSYAWKKLRIEVMSRDQHSCKYCEIKLGKYLKMDHINYDCTDNRLENLALCCDLCFTIRHCEVGLARDHLILFISKLRQVDIVRKSVEFYKKQKRVPKPTEVDGDAKKAELSMREFAKLIEKHGYEKLPKFRQYYFKAFFKYDETRRIFQRISANIIRPL